MTEIWKDVQVYRKGILLKFDDYQVEYYTQQVKRTQFQNSVMKISVTPLHKIYNSILI